MAQVVTLPSIRLVSKKPENRRGFGKGVLVAFPEAKIVVSESLSEKIFLVTQLFAQVEMVNGFGSEQFRSKLRVIESNILSAKDEQLPKDVRQKRANSAIVALLFISFKSIMEAVEEGDDRVVANELAQSLIGFLEKLCLPNTDCLK